MNYTVLTLKCLIKINKYKLALDECIIAKHKDECDIDMIIDSMCDLDTIQTIILQ